MLITSQFILHYKIIIYEWGNVKKIGNLQSQGKVRL